jgi:hypothetical protein
MICTEKAEVYIGTIDDRPVTYEQMLKAAAELTEWAKIAPPPKKRPDSEKFQNALRI